MSSIVPPEERKDTPQKEGEKIQVAVRVRPPLTSELVKEEVVLCGNNGTSIKIVDHTHLIESSYDAVFSTKSAQSDVYDFAKESVLSVFDGINCTIFAYGQTGSGKTYTMFGPNWEESVQAGVTQLLGGTRKAETSTFSFDLDFHGIIPRAINDVFQRIADIQTSTKFTLVCSFLQVYNEKLYDLLQDPKTIKPLQIREEKLTGIYVEGLTEYVIMNARDCFALLRRGERNRKTRQTRANISSSRSHSIFQLMIETDRVDKRGFLKRAKLNLCDLAGSEKINKEEEMGNKHFQELTTINRSLTTLGKVISSIC